MDLAKIFHGRVICIDTAPIIYYIESHPRYIDILRPLFVEINSGAIRAFTSTISLLEVMVFPLRKGEVLLAERYRDILLYSENFRVYEITNNISEKAARLRAEYDIRTPDAIQIATGIKGGAEVFLTNDLRLKRIKEIEIIVLEEFID